MIAVLTSEAAALIVETHPVLPATRFRADGHRAWINDKIMAAQFQGCHLGMAQRRDSTAVPARDPVNPVVQPPIKTVQHRLHVEVIGFIGRIFLGEAGENDFAHIGFPITISVLRVDTDGA